MRCDKRTKDTDDKSGWRQWVFPLAVIALWCAPAAAINVTHGLHAGKEPALIMASIFAVFGASMCGLRLETPQAFSAKLITGACLTVLVAFNFSNAIGLSAGHREHARSDALTAQNVRALLADEARTIAGTIAGLDRELGTSSVSSLKAEIATAEYSPLFTRSKKCTDATLAESRNHCAAWEKAKAMLAAAERREVLRTKLSGLNEQLRAAPVVDTADPQADAISRVLAFAGLTVEPRDAGYALTLVFALAIELMAAFGASWCGVRLPTHDVPHGEGVTLAPVVSTAKPAPQAAREPLDGFLNEIVRCDRPMPFKALYAVYEDYCRAAGVTPATRRAVGLALSRRFEKTRGGDAAYFARPRLTGMASAA